MTRTNGVSIQVTNEKVLGEWLKSRGVGETTDLAVFGTPNFHYREEGRGLFGKGAVDRRRVS